MRRYRRPVRPSKKQPDVPKEIRAQNVAALAEQGFTVSPGLPLMKTWVIELNYTRAAWRLLSLKAVVCYVTLSPAQLPTERIQATIRENKLAAYITQAERAMLTMDRAQSHQKHLDMVGWKLENMVALARLFGSTILEEIGLQMCGDEHVGRLLTTDSPPFGGSANEWAHAQNRMDALEVVMLEDFFYCLHNAVRNIAFGGLQNTTELDPRVLVGIVQERRHSLTWAVGNLDWDETDLST